MSPTPTVKGPAPILLPKLPAGGVTDGVGRIMHARAVWGDQIIAGDTSAHILEFGTGTGYDGVYQDTDGFFDQPGDQIVIPVCGLYWGMAHITWDIGAGYVFFAHSTSSPEFDEHVTYDATNIIGPRLNLPFGPRVFAAGDTMQWTVAHDIAGTIAFTDKIISIAGFELPEGYCEEHIEH